MRFRVSGALASDVEEAPANVIPSVDSLPLKPSGKQQKITPTPSQDLNQCVQSHASRQPVIERLGETRQHEPQPESVSRSRDALDDMIDAAKAAKGLVSFSCSHLQSLADRRNSLWIPWSLVMGKLLWRPPILKPLRHRTQNQ